MFTQKQDASIDRSHDRFSYLWLALAALLIPFGTARWNIPLAAWLYPIFLLRFVRTQPRWRGFLLCVLAISLVLSLTWPGFLPMPMPLYALLIMILGILYTLPYLIDRLVTPRLTGITGSLVFPLASTTIWFLWGFLNPWGSQYNPAYTQYGNLPLLQLLSITGLWGIVFLMCWLASLVNWAREWNFSLPKIGKAAVLYGSLLALILLYGGVRLAFMPPQGNTVRVAGISPSPKLVEAFGKYSQFSKEETQLLLSGNATPAMRATIHQASLPLFDQMLAHSEQEARTGAKIILWPECSGAVYVLQEDVPALLSRASTIARSTGSYLDLGLCVLMSQPVQGNIGLDRAILIDPGGNVVWQFDKAHPILLVESTTPGDGRVPTVQTPYGRLSTVICFDDLFTSTLRQAGQAGADIMLVPSNDWREIDPSHAQQATFRAIENGYSLVVQTSNGLAMAVDYEGNVLAAADYFTNNPQVIVASVPVRGVRTIYAATGDWFAWLSLVGLLVISGTTIVHRRKIRELHPKEQSGEAFPIS